ncbi:hypothetical protein AAFF_G00167920 [Aldrovandia affinis]|uniref:Uncharacterized protein n=1 Tax=Aldrovandia affinis TaxID=143900 RepID=A0AAD7RPN1_9TELE|nr:hypothetical protein AAFF_G00167920 [Aldrovandia affinis]
MLKIYSFRSAESWLNICKQNGRPLHQWRPKDTHFQWEALRCGSPALYLDFRVRLRLASSERRAARRGVAWRRLGPVWSALSACAGFARRCQAPHARACVKGAGADLAALGLVSGPPAPGQGRVICGTARSARPRLLDCHGS